MAKKFRRLLLGSLLMEGPYLYVGQIFQIPSILDYISKFTRVYAS